MSAYRRKGRRGANAVEFALTLPLFIAIVFGMMEFGYFFSQRALTNSVLGRACREAALVDPNNPPADITNCGGDGDDCVEKAAEKHLTEMSLAANITCTSCTGVVSGVTGARKVECSMEVDYEDITGFFEAFFPSTFESKTSARLEWQRLSSS